ncbi:hypothetical protein Q9L58_001907 [Maublancomyces gigas]|uniref:Uncharacterized protein n=1 Tax=Discina gigas TaxID=1032678 RepID=A0ABR3GT92_9PEZI
MGFGISSLRNLYTSHTPSYQSDTKVHMTAMDWQEARHARINNLSLQNISYETVSGLHIGFQWQLEIQLREDETETDFFQAVESHGRYQQDAMLLSKTGYVNLLTGATLAIWIIILITSILPIRPTTNPGKRDLSEALLEVGEKMVGFAAVTAKSFAWRVVTFCIVAGYSILKKRLEIHVDTALKRSASPTWAFIGPLVAKAFEHLAYAIRLAPASRAWAFLHERPDRQSRYISSEQWARRCLWADGQYRQFLREKQECRGKICATR